MVGARTWGNKRTNAASGGFTLIELMLTIAILSVLTLIALPSFETLRLRQQVRAVVSDFDSSYRLARHEAQLRRSPVTLCPSDKEMNACGDDWQNGWLIMAGSEVLRYSPPAAETLTVKLTDSEGKKDKKEIAFLPTGRLQIAFAGTQLAITDKKTSAKIKHYVCIDRNGIIKGQEDPCKNKK